MEGESHRLAAGAIAGDAPTVADTHPPFEPSRTLAAESGYYNVSWSVIDTEPGWSYSIGIDVNPNDTSGERIAYADLPAVDRRALATLRDASVPAEAERDGPELGVNAVYNASEREQSVLVPTLEYELVTVDGETVRLSSEGSRTVTINTYQYDATQVAASATALAADLESRYLFTLSGLSEGERKIVDDAIGDTHYESGSVSDDFASLAATFHAHDPIYEAYGDSEYLVRYDGTTYWARLYAPPERID
jgi:hypothetical protein